MVNPLERINDKEMFKAMEETGVKNNKKRNRIILIVVLCVVAFGVIVFAIVYSTSTKKREDEGTVEKIAKHDVEQTVDAAGVVDSISLEEVKSPVFGSKIKKVYVKKGDTVAPGQVICQLDTTDLQKSYVELQKSISQTKADKIKYNQEYDKYLADEQSDKDAQINEIKQAIFGAQAEYNAYSNELNKERDRYNQYLSDWSHSEWDPEAIEMESNISDLESNVEVSQYKMNAYQEILNGVVEANNGSSDDGEFRKSINDMSDSSIATLEEYARDIQKSISESTVRCTVGGVVTSLNVSEGDSYVGGAICVVENTDSFMVMGEITEHDVADIAVGQKVKVKTDSTRDQVLTGVVTYVAPRANMTSSGNATSFSSLAAGAGSTVANAVGASAKYQIMVALNEQNPRLRLGMNASLKIITKEAPNTLSVSTRAIKQDDDGSKYVEIVTNADKAEKDDSVSYDKKKTEVNVGLIGQTYTEVHGTGISDEEYVYVPSSDEETLEAIIKYFSANESE